MPLGEPPDDPVLAELLQLGEFEYFIRVASRSGSGTGAAKLLEQLLPEMSAEAHDWMVSAVLASLATAKAMDSLAPEERLNPDDIPHIPSRGIPDALPGDLVALSHALMPDARDKGIDAGIDTATIFVAPPTKEELSEAQKQLEEQIRDQYDLKHISRQEMIDAIEQLQGMYYIS